MNNPSDYTASIYFIQVYERGQHFDRKDEEFYICSSKCKK